MKINPVINLSNPDTRLEPAPAAHPQEMALRAMLSEQDLMVARVDARASEIAVAMIHQTDTDKFSTTEDWGRFIAKNSYMLAWRLEQQRQRGNEPILAEGSDDEPEP